MFSLSSSVFPCHCFMSAEDWSSNFTHPVHLFLMCTIGKTDVMVCQYWCPHLRWFVNKAACYNVDTETLWLHCTVLWEPSKMHTLALAWSECIIWREVLVFQATWLMIGLLKAVGGGGVEFNSMPHHPTVTPCSCFQSLLNFSKPHLTKSDGITWSRSLRS
jgi:hypothetical protein